MTKNAFYFTLKALFIIKIFNFLPFFVMYKNGMVRKIRLIPKFMTSQPEKKATLIHILSNISTQSDNEICSVNKM